jgi:hypothetical protein
MNIEHIILNIEQLFFLSSGSYRAFIFYIEHLNFTDIFISFILKMINVII